jgi:hypothetical protein
MEYILQLEHFEDKENGRIILKIILLSYVMYYLEY